MTQSVTHRPAHGPPEDAAWNPSAMVPIDCSVHAVSGLPLGG